MQFGDGYYSFKATGTTLTGTRTQASFRRFYPSTVSSWFQGISMKSLGKLMITSGAISEHTYPQFKFYICPSSNLIEMHEIVHEVKHTCR
jgi:hypothetical protein